MWPELFFSYCPCFGDLYNVIEVFQKESDGVWRVVHSTWDKIKPYGKDHKIKEIK